MILIIGKCCYIGVRWIPDLAENYPNKIELLFNFVAVSSKKAESLRFRTYILTLEVLVQIYSKTPGVLFRIFHGFTQTVKENNGIAS